MTAAPKPPAHPWSLDHATAVAQRIQQQLNLPYGVTQRELTGIRELTHVKQLSISVVQCLGAGQSPEADERARRHLD